jgi:hypothetical protein
MHITINGFPTWEVDYSGLHINMLYALEKQPLPKVDVYRLPSFSNTKIFRNFVKRMLLVMVNASSRSIVRQVLHEEVYKKKSLELPKDIKSTRGVDIFPVMDAFEREHAPIRKYFCTGEGVNLQYHDSVIAEAILVFFAKNNIPCLPVHDSFVVDFRYREMLEWAMQEAFLKYFGQQATVTRKKFIGIKILNDTISEINKRRSRSKKKMKKEVKDIDRDYTQYYKMLKEFFEVKGPNLEKDKIDTQNLEEFLDIHTFLLARHEELLKLFDELKKQFPNVPVQ